MSPETISIAIVLFAVLVGSIFLTVRGLLKGRMKQEPEQEKPRRSSKVHLESVRMSAGSRLTIDGMTFLMQGGRLTVNGVPWGPMTEDGEPLPLPEPVEVTLTSDGVVSGNIQGDLIVHGPGPVTLLIEGGVGGLVRVENGSVSCKDVRGDVTANGSVECADVRGSVQANLDITCRNVRGSVTAGGAVKCGDVRGRVTAHEGES